LNADLTAGAPGLEFHPAIARGPDDIVLMTAMTAAIST
jgi:hypothetical protein